MLSLSVTTRAMMPAHVLFSVGGRTTTSEKQGSTGETKAVVQPKRLFADAGYGAEWVHNFCREDWHLESWIPSAVHYKDGTFNGQYRSQMTATTLRQEGYGRRWIVESFMSALKRTTGLALHARNERSLFVEAGLRVLAYAIRR